jgi:hypothetical protein
MSEILNYTTFDDTPRALACWRNMSATERAQHVLTDSAEYRVYLKAKSNEANITSLQQSLSNLPKWNPTEHLTWTTPLNIK